MLSAANGIYGSGNIAEATDLIIDNWQRVAKENGWNALDGMGKGGQRRKAPTRARRRRAR
jgi:hypothetical protein